ncbi:MAG: mechanosensitive ion channel [Clostridia bacterium]
MKPQFLTVISDIVDSVTSDFAEETTEAAATEATTTTNLFLDESGQFADVSDVVENVSTWWQDLDIVNKVIDILPTMILAVLTVVAGFIIAKFAVKILLKAMKKQNVDPSVYKFISSIVSFVIKCTFIISALSMFMNVYSIIAAFSAVGVAAGLGLQSSVSQFASGVQILFNHPFKTGDFVEINGVTGNVCEIRFMNTVINTIDNKRVVIPNSHVTENHIINYTAEENRRVDLTFSISYSDDIKKAKAILYDAAIASGLAVTEPEPQVFVNSHEASSIDLVIKIWCKVEEYWNLYYYMQEQVKLEFDSAGINIPFNQLDVHIINPDKK